jgi:hypothetical protein
MIILKYSKDKSRLKKKIKGYLKFFGQVGLGLIVGIVLFYFHAGKL